MPLKFVPIYTITPQIAQNLIEIGAIKERVTLLPVAPTLINSLRETAKLYTTHYSTMIEGNQLLLHQIEEVITLEGHFPGRERDEKEVKGYYAALAEVEAHARRGQPVTEKVIQKLHALVMSDGRSNLKPTPYRDGQNVIRDSSTGTIIYMPPEAGDARKLMESMVEWINGAEDLPTPVTAAIAHYQFATIHPYFDGNGRTARLLTTLIMHLGGYDLKGLYSLEEYYAQNLLAYYRAISIGPSHNYYMGRAESDITPWVEYFIEGVVFAFKKVLAQMEGSLGKKDYSPLLRKLDPKQRKVLGLFKEYQHVTSQQIGAVFGFREKTSSMLAKKWVEDGFLEITDPAKKSRTYGLAQTYWPLLEED